MSEDNYNRLDNGQLINYFHKNHPDTTRYQLKEANFPLWNEFRERKLMLVLPLKIEPKLDERVLALRPNLTSEPVEQSEEEPPRAQQRGRVRRVKARPSKHIKHGQMDNYVVYSTSSLNGISKPQLKEAHPDLYDLMVADGSITAVPDKPYNNNPVEFSIENYGRLNSSADLKHINYRLWKELFEKGLLYKIIKQISTRMEAS